MRPILVIFCLILLLAACNQDDDSLQFSDLPTGDAARGEALFTQQVNGAPACSSCHNINDKDSSGPALAGYAERAGKRVKEESAEQYTLTSILQPASHIVDNYSNLMYRNYEEKLTHQQIADLIAYLLTL